MDRRRVESLPDDQLPRYGLPVYGRKFLCEESILCSKKSKMLNNSQQASARCSVLDEPGNLSYFDAVRE